MADSRIVAFQRRVLVLLCVVIASIAFYAILRRRDLVLTKIFHSPKVRRA